jgi:hypothetical protein
MALASSTPRASHHIRTTSRWKAPASACMFTHACMQFSKGKVPHEDARETYTMYLRKTYMYFRTTHPVQCNVSSYRRTHLDDSSAACW